MNSIAPIRGGTHGPLCDFDAEAAVLSTLLLEPMRFSEVAQHVRARHFFIDAHQIVFRAIERLLADQQKVDTVTLATFLREDGKLDRVGGTPFLGQLVDATPSVANVAEHARTVQNLAARRFIAHEADNLALRARQGEPLGDLRAGIDRLQKATKESRKRIHLATLEDAMAEPDEPIQWVWSERHLVAPGRPTIVGAYGGTGKTWLVLAMALSVATGIAFLGTFPTRSGRAIVLEYETSGRRLRRRMRRMVHGYGVAEGLERLEFAAQEDLDLWLTSRGAEEELSTLCAGAVLLVVDSLIQGSPGLKENDAEMAGPLHMLARVSARTGCAVVVLHHERKATQENAGGPGQSLRGHSALQAACDAVWRLAASGDAISMVPTKVSDGKTPTGWELRIVDTEGGGIVIEAQDLQGELESGSLDDRVLEAISERPGMSGRHLRAAVGGRPQFVLDALARLELSGAIECQTGERNSKLWFPKGFIQ